jgi:hypothetical protein
MRQLLDLLTERELDVLQLIARGASFRTDVSSSQYGQLFLLSTLTAYRKSVQSC